MKTDDTSSGIYEIKCVPNGKVYIGSAICFKQRLYTHLSQLRLNKHHSPYLQSSWNMYGQDCFTFEILEYVEKSFLLDAEQVQINGKKSANRNYGFNVCPIAGSPIGRKASKETIEKLRKIMIGNSYRLGIPHTNETLEKLRRARVGRTPAKGMKVTPENKELISKMFKGKPLSVAHAKKISSAMKGKEKSSLHRSRLSSSQATMTHENIANIRQQYSLGGVSMKAISVEFGCSAQTICNVINGKKMAYRLP